MKHSFCSALFITKVLAVSALLATHAVTAGDWAQWRGPLRDGVSKETGLLQEWPSGGPKLLWHAKAIGAGYSTPSVVGDRIYLLSNDGLEDESVMALSTAGGAKIWSTRVGKVGNPKQNPSYPAARSTPTVDGGLLYALGSDGDLVCLDTAKGGVKWQKNLRTDFGGKPGEWAYAESPLVDGEALLCTPGGKEATIVALNKKTGAVLWKCPMPEGDDAAYSCIMKAEFGGVAQYVQFLAGALVGVEAKTGKPLWRYEKTAKGSPAVIITPLIHGDLIYSGAFKAGAGVVRPVKKDGKFSVEEVYFANKLPIGLGGVVRVGDYFYGSSSQSAMCVEFKTGDVKWEERSVGPCSWLVADKCLYLHAENGPVVLLSPSPDGYREKGKFTPADAPAHGQSKAWAYPVVANGRLYIRDWTSLWCYDVKAAQ